MKRGSKYSFQRIYPYVCKSCKEKRYTRFFNRRENEICTLCRRKEVDKNQMSLLGVSEVELGGDTEKGMLLEVGEDGKSSPLDNDKQLTHN